MGRLLLFVVLAFAVWFVVRAIGGMRKGVGRSPVERREATTAQPEAMRQCAWCGAHVPSGHALMLPDGRVYCSTAHRDAAADASDRGG